MTLRPKKFDTLDNKTFLRILGAAAGGDFSAQSIDALREIPIEKLNLTAHEMRQAALRAADFIATEVGAPRAEALPYANQFVVMSELFRVLPHPDSAQLNHLRAWFWLTTLSGYFGGWDSGQMTTDTRAIRSFGKGETDSLGSGGVIPSATLWELKSFRANSAVSKMLALMITYAAPLTCWTAKKLTSISHLLGRTTRNFTISFHSRIFRSIRREPILTVGNIVMLTSVSNIAISDRPPSDYLSQRVEDVGRQEVVRRLASNLVPEQALDRALEDDYVGILKVRSSYLHTHALTLAGQESCPQILRSGRTISRTMTSTRRIDRWFTASGPQRSEDTRAVRRSAA